MTLYFHLEALGKLSGKTGLASETLLAMDADLVEALCVIGDEVGRVNKDSP